MQLVNTVLLSFVAVTTSLICLFLFMITRRNNKNNLRLMRDSKLDVIIKPAQDFNTQCTGLLEIANALRAKLSRIESMGWKRADNGDMGQRSALNNAEAGEQHLHEETLIIQALVEKLKHSYIECYLPASDKLLHQESEAASIRDGDISKLFTELVLLKSHVEATWQKLDETLPVEKARVLQGHFSRMSNYVYLLSETSQQITDRIICLKNQGC
jgi:hypothetical protein